MASDNSPLLPVAVNTLISAIITFPPWAKLLLRGLEYPSFIIAVLSAVIGTVLALQFTKGNKRLQVFAGFILCCAVLGYYTIWSINGSPLYVLYFALFLIFVIFLIGSYYLTLLLLLINRTGSSSN